MAGGSYVGLDIGSNQIKVAEVRRSGGGLEVTALGVAPTPVEGYENNTIRDAQVLGKAVKDLMKSSGVRTSDCVSSVSGQGSVVVRVIEVPQMTPAELADTMKWEVEKHVPFAASEVIMDYQAIERPEGYAEGQNMDVLLAVAQQNMVDAHVDMLFSAGLKPKAIDVEALAAARNLLDVTPNTTTGFTVAVINIGASITDVGIYRDRLLTFPRTILLAGDNLTRAIADAFQVDVTAAEQYKRDVGEVILDQMGPGGQAPGGYTDPGFTPGGGFYDFGAPGGAVPGFVAPAEAPSTASGIFAPGGAFTGAVQPSAPPVPQSSPSGRMPFDFATPGEDEPAPLPFGMGGAPAPVAPSGPMDLSGDFSQHQPPPVDYSGQPAPVSDLPAAVEYSAPAPAAIVPVDPGREQFRQNVFNAMAPVLAELSQELRRSIDYYRGRSSDAVIHEAVLCGGTARLKGIAAYLEAELGIPTRIADPMEGLNVTAKSFSPEHLREISSIFPVSIGLAARDLLMEPGAAKKKRR